MSPAFPSYRRTRLYTTLHWERAGCLRQRFSESQKVAMHLAQLLPEHCKDAKAVDCAIDVFRQYEDRLAGMDACRAEFERWQHWCSRLEPQQRSNSISGALALFDATLFPNMRTVLKIFATLPVTTCTAERSFSALRLVKTHLRPTMGNNRLTGLALLSVHKTVKQNYDSLIAEYMSKFSTRARLTE